jgi:hypothetical protein
MTRQQVYQWATAQSWQRFFVNGLDDYYIAPSGAVIMTHFMADNTLDGVELLRTVKLS